MRITKKRNKQIDVHINVCVKLPGRPKRPCAPQPDLTSNLPDPWQGAAESRKNPACEQPPTTESLTLLVTDLYNTQINVNIYSC